MSKKSYNIGVNYTVYFSFENEGGILQQVGLSMRRVRDLAVGGQHLSKSCVVVFQQRRIENRQFN